jgi:hypothetical protein
MNTTTTTPIEIIAIRETVENSYAKWDRYVWKRDNGTGASEEWDAKREAFDAQEKATRAALESVSAILDDVYSTDYRPWRDVASAIDATQEWPASQGWDCTEKMIAYRHGDALYIWWYRKVWGNRRERDLWVLVDENYFAHT